MLTVIRFPCLLRSMAFLLVCLGSTPSTYGDPQLLSKVLQSMIFDRGRYHQDIRELITEHSHQITQGKDEEKRKAAATFFHDIRERGVIIELLEDEQVRDLVAEKYLDILELDNLSRMFMISFDWLPKTKARDRLDEKSQALRNKRVDSTLKAAAQILKVDVVPVQEYTQPALKESWTKMVTTAKEKRTLWKPVDETYGKIKEDLKKIEEEEKKEKDVPKKP